MDKIFKALNDPARRAILDSLRQKDGQSLSELESQFDMTRFGVMKHLALLEDAGLVLSKKQGRFKYHYLNAVPLQEVIDRWIEPLLAGPVARGLLDLKTHLEKETPMSATVSSPDTATSESTTAAKPDFIHQTMIRCSQDALWDALTLADQVALHHFACDRATGDATAPDAALTMIRKDGSTMLTQRVISLTPKSRIDMTFEPNFCEGDNTPSHIAFLIDVEGDICKLTCEHYAVPPAHQGIRDGWMRFAASLKSWLETGTPIKEDG